VNRDTTSTIIKRLKEKKKEEGNLPLLLGFYQKILEIHAETQKNIGAPVPVLSRMTINQRIRKGLPLVNFNELALDWPLVPDVFAKAVAAFARYPELFGEIPARMKKPGAGRMLTKKAARAWFTGQELPSSLLDGISENLMQTIIQATLQPFLVKYAQALIGFVDQESWRRSYCPICGGSPDLAFLEKEHGARWLLCSRCDTEWLFQRLECPYCANKEQNTLAFFSDEEGLYRLYVCDKCRCYLKAIDLRKTEAEVLLPLERFYTMDLDRQAKEYGYNSCQKFTAKKK
jgi:FdhE protein